MIIEHKLGSLGNENAYVMSDELIMGKRVMYFGGGIDECNTVFNEEPERISDKKIFQYASYSDYLVGNIERVITHETMHLTIYDLTHSLHATGCYDNIDGDNEITSFIPPNL